MKSLNSTRVVPTILFGLLLLPAIAAAAPAKVAVLPFAIHSDKDYTFLQKGIVEMLSSRLASPGKVEVLDPIATTNAMAEAKGLSGDKLAQAVAGKLGADVAIHGSLTVLGESVSIDAKTLDITGGRQPLTFFKQTNGMGEVIPQINVMAGEINSKLFGVTAPAAAAPAAVGAGAAVAAGAAAASAAQPDIHMHPEKLLQSGQVASAEGLPPSPLVSAAAPTEQSSSALNPAFVPAPGTLASGDPGFWKSRGFEHLINGIDVGDVDKDGQQETVVATPEQIFIYRFVQGKQQSVAEIKGGLMRFISVSIGDINRNSTPEIFVTGFASNLNALESSVYEFDGRNFVPIVKKSRYYYSVARHPALGDMLLGQKQVNDESIYADPIFEMAWKGGEYVPERQVLKRKGNLLGFAYGDIMQNGSESIVVLDESEQLQLLTPDGKRQWLSEDKYGGTMLYYQPPSKAIGNMNTISYLPIRIRTADLDGNNKLEVLVIQNHDRARRLMTQQRIFSSGQIEALAWDGLGLAPAWKTRTLSGRIQDFAIGDFDNDGTNELLIAVVTKEGAVIFTDAQSSLVAFDLKPVR
ncbi:MAG: VCBS repeat-containing protein [Desulfobacterales bacterium]|nr:VCBS repeat-containing protein [Desulfobacterales bacterium]